MAMVSLISLDPWILVALFFILIAIFYLILKAQFPSAQKIKSLLNQQEIQLEYSIHLLFLPSPVGIQALQQQIISEKVTENLSKIELPVKWKITWISVALSISLITMGLVLQNTNKDESNMLPSLIEQNNSNIITTLIDSVILEDLKISIDPPPYTGLKNIQLTDPNLSIPEGSTVKWTAKFSSSPSNVWLRFSSGDSIALTASDNVWVKAINRNEPGFYSINFIDKYGSSVHSPYYEFLIVADDAPAISITGISQFQRLAFRTDIDFSFDVSITDDYGLLDAHTVGTITKGSGESVLFREEKFNFGQQISGKSGSFVMQFNSSDLGMEPGNEFYFYVTAFDNKIPESQQSRTETFFFILEDTTDIEFSIAGGLGVNLMPDFFRSQLQIIIDTEKLIEERPTLTAHVHNATSNELGFDQKQLRLKYGQFIGEEEDSGLEIDQELPVPTEPIEETEGGEATVDILGEFGHDTDHENEEGQLMDKGTWQHESEHEPREFNDDGEIIEDPLEAYLHNHENEETATFLTQTIKSKLRAALNEMWDAELYLRLYQPENSLPYQYKALKLLNEIKNHARIYVQRIGFDPPPINEEESRLSKELKDIHLESYVNKIDPKSNYPKISIALKAINTTLTASSLSNQIGDLLKEAGNELTQLALQNPGAYLSELTVIQILADKSNFENEDLLMLAQLQTIFMKILEDEPSLPKSNNYSEHPLIQSFIKELNDPTVND
jgi:hypothetical protein